MSFPRNNLSIVFPDLPVNSETQMAKILYLPLKRSRSYLKFFNKFRKSKKCIYIRHFSIPDDLMVEIQPCIIQPLRERTFANLREPLPSVEKMKHILGKDFKSRRRDFNRWMKIIRRVEKWDLNVDNFNRAAFLCSLLLSMSISETCLKHQMRITYNSC